MKTKIVDGAKLDEEMKELERELRREGTRLAGGARPLEERITLNPGLTQQMRLAEGMRRYRGGSILDRYKDFMSGTKSVTQQADQTRLIFLQKDLAIAEGQLARQITGTVRPPSGRGYAFRDDHQTLSGVWGSLVTPFLEADAPEGSPRKHRPKEGQPFFLGEPFPITWIEAPGDVLFVIKQVSKESLLMIDNDDKIMQALDPCDDEHKEMIPIRAIWLWRSSPEMYTAVLIGDKGYKLATIITESNQRDPSFFGDSAVHWFLFELFQKLARQGQLGTERVNDRFKVGSGKGKAVVKIKDVIHIRAKQRVAGPSITPDGRTIEWSHRWEVMGHWRKVNGVGKDDQGRYHVQGFTWVLPHTKGPEEKEVVKKTRIYIGGKEQP